MNPRTLWVNGLRTIFDVNLSPRFTKAYYLAALTIGGGNYLFKTILLDSLRQYIKR
jgi:hypothetical protein